MYVLNYKSIALVLNMAGDHFAGNIRNKSKAESNAEEYVVICCIVHNRMLEVDFRKEHIHIK